MVHLCKFEENPFTGSRDILHTRARPRSAIGRAPASYVRGPGFDTRSGNIISFLLPLFSRRAIVSYWRKYVHEVLVNGLGGLCLPRKSVVRLTDRPDMTLDVYRGRKTTMQQQLTYKTMTLKMGSRSPKP